jgi:hypothetical protein
VKMVGREGGDHQRSRRSPAVKVSRAWGWGGEVGAPSSSHISVFLVPIRSREEWIGQVLFLQFIHLPCRRFTILLEGLVS